LGIASVAGGATAVVAAAAIKDYVIDLAQEAYGLVADLPVAMSRMPIASSLSFN